MKSFWRFTYSWLLLPLAWGLAWWAALAHPKLKASLAGRRGLWRRLESQLKGRNPSQPLAWFHVSSAGEFLQAQPVMERLMAGGWQVALTVFSVTGYQWAAPRQGQPGQPLVVEYLPIDFPGNMRRLIKLLRPQALVCVKFDLWPNMIWQAQAAGVAVHLISATLRPGSYRLNNPLGRSLFRAVYGAIDGIYPVTEDDRQRFLRTLPGHPGVVTVGDTRFDSVLDRKKRVTMPPLPGWLRQGRVMIAGSTWPSDEDHLLPALTKALERHPDLVAVVAPHEVGEDHLGPLEEALKGWPLIRFTRLRPDSPPHRLVLVDTVGQLSALYTVAHLAYVGGAFSTGVHNTMEPSAMGAPALFGPRHDNSPEALELAAQGLAYPVKDGAELETRLLALLDHPEEVTATGRKAAAFIQQKSGASDACFQLISKGRK